MKSKGNPLFKYSILLRVRDQLSRFWGRLLHRLRKGSPACTQPLPPASDPGQVDWTAQDAMVGTVRNREQLHYNLSHNCYYVPARFMPEAQPPVQYIALHEWDGEDIPCIFRVARVKAVQQVPRQTIPVTMRKETDPGEIYLYYTVEQWNPLPHRILIRDTARGKPLFTNKFLLEHCRASYELFIISSRQDYCLLERLYTLLGTKDPTPPACPVTETRRLSLENGVLSLTDEKGHTLCSLPHKTYITNPRISFLYLKKFLT